MAKFVEVMTAKIESFDTVRQFGIDLLVQIVAVAAFYMIVNHFKEVGAEKLGATHFMFSLIILALLTTYQIYRKKLRFMRGE